MDNSNNRKNHSVRRTNIGYYITGHGLGHATRSLELIRYLIQSDSFNVHVISLVRKSFFEEGLRELGIALYDNTANEVRFSHEQRSIDTGAVQKDVFIVDPTATLEIYYQEIHLNRNSILDFETAEIRRLGIDLVLVDATPLACMIGHLSGVKTVLVSNFMWPFCFGEMLEIVSQNAGSGGSGGSGGSATALAAGVDADVGVTESGDVLKLEEYRKMVAQCVADTAACDYYLQLPGETPLPPDFPPEKVILGPLLARGLLLEELQYNESDDSSRSSSSSSYAHAALQLLRAQYSIEEGAKVLLLGFGGHSATWALEDAYLPDGWVCLTLGANAADMPSARFRALPADTYVPNLIFLANAVLGKIGYGFVSECIRAGTILIFVPRQNWPEERFLQKLLTESYPAGICMPQTEFESGSWSSYLQEAAARKRSWEVTQEHNCATALPRITTILQNIMKNNLI